MSRWPEKTAVFNSFMDRLVSRLLPESLAQAGENTRRRARLVVLFSFTIFLCGPVYGVLYLALGMNVSALGALVAATVLFATPFLQRRTGSVDLGAHLVAFGCYAALALVTAPTGGLSAPAVAWLALIPVTALMLGGASAGRIWTAISLATVVAYFAVDWADHTPVSEVPQDWVSVLRLVVNLGLVGLIALLAWLYESNKDRMLATVEAANAEVARSRDEAQAAHRGARQVLDHVAQGLLIVDRHHTLVGEHSRFAAALFERLPTIDRIPDLFREQDPTFAATLEIGLDGVFEGLLPLEAALDQLPSTCRFGARSLSFAYVPVLREGAVERVLLVIGDETDKLAARELERKNREQLDVFRWIVKDGAYFAQAFRELGALTRAVSEEVTPWEERLRLLHTLKGDAGVFGLSSLARHCHHLEEQIRDRQQTALTDEQREKLTEVWQVTTHLVEPLLGNWRSDLISVTRGDYDELLETFAVRDPKLHARLLRWSWESAGAHLQRLGEQAKALAERLLISDLQIVIDDDGTRVPPELAAVWSVSGHLIRNALDHGIETTDQRRAAGKPAGGRLHLRARIEGSCFLVEIEDDGRGVDWAAVKKKALTLGLPTANERDLERALFADGLSTRDTASELSGRGVGMAAVLARCHSLGGSIEVRSQLGLGTCVRMKFPALPQALAS